MKMLRHLLAACLIALAGAASAQTVTVNGNIAPFTPPNVPGIVCGADGTAAINAALVAASTNRGAVALPPCPKTSPIVISATLLIPSNTSLLGATTGTTWLQEAASANLQPMIANTSFACSSTTICNSNIEIGFLSIDGNGSNQTANLLTRCVYFVGVANLSMHDMEVDNCRSDAVSHDGNGAAGVEPTFANRIFVNTTIGGGNIGAGLGFTIGNRARNASVSNIVTLNTSYIGVLIDASESNWSSITAKGSGTGNTCTNATTHTADNPGGGSTNVNWSPCPANIFVRNVTNVTGTNFLSSQGLYHGIIITGARHTALSNITSTNNSQQSIGTWDDMHLDLNVFNPGYGENHALSISGVNLGSNSQAVTTPNQSSTSSPPTSRYGLFIADGLAGSVGDVAVVSGGTSYAFNNTLTLAGGTSTIAGALTVTAAPGGIISTVSHSYTNGAGVYTVLPANPVSVTGGAGTLATFNVTWSTAYLTGIVIGSTVTAAKRLPAFITNWTVSTVP